MEKRIKELGLRQIEITEGGNGYPKNCYPAVIGFENFEQAEQFVKDFAYCNECAKQRRRRVFEGIWSVNLPSAVVSYLVDNWERFPQRLIV